MSADFYMIVGIALVSILGLAYLFIKDLENQRKLKSYEKSIEDLNKQLYNFQKKFDSLKENNQSDMQNSSKSIDAKVNEMRAELQNDLKNALSNISPLIDVLEGIQKSFQIHKNKIDLRMEQIEERVKSVLSISNILSSSDEERIVSMFKEGKAPEEIAKELRLTKGEVDFVLKVFNLDANNRQKSNQIDKVENEVDEKVSEKVE